MLRRGYSGGGALDGVLLKRESSRGCAKRVCARGDALEGGLKIGVLKRECSSGKAQERAQEIALERAQERASKQANRKARMQAS